MSEETDKEEIAHLRQVIAAYLESYDIDETKAYMIANHVLKLCAAAGLRKFAPAEEGGSDETLLGVRI